MRRHGWNNRLERLKNPDYVDSYHRRRRGDCIAFKVAYRPANSQIPYFWGVVMNTLQRLAAITDATGNLIAQLRELNELREQVRKAEVLARRSRPISRRKKTFNSESAPSARLGRYDQLLR